jgi:hypothetical protein
MNYTSLVPLLRFHRTHFNLLLSGNKLYFVSLLLLQELYSSVKIHFDKHPLGVKSVKCHYQFVFVGHPPCSKNNY